MILENFFDDLDNRPMCLSSPNVPTPYSGPLEEVSIVQTADIIESVEQILTNKM